MDFAVDEKYDNVLLDIIQYVEKLPNFLDIIFGFLRRRTDLYHILTNEKQNMGFLPGEAEKLILSAFHKHKSIAGSNIKDIQASKTKPEINRKTEVAAKESIIKTENCSSTVNKPVVEVSKEPERVDSDSYVQDADCYNGAVRDNYSWSQTIEDLDIRVNMPPYVASSKQVKVDVDRKCLCVSVCPSVGDGHYTTILEGALPWDVRRTDVIWSLDLIDRQVHIALEKVQERWWDAFFVGEPTIDTRAIDCSRPMADLDDEAQAKIHKLMYDQHQKQLGLPTSDQQKVTEALRAAWNMDGSPFQGTEYDPGQVDLIGNSTSM